MSLKHKGYLLVTATAWTLLFAAFPSIGQDIQLEHKSSMGTATSQASMPASQSQFNQRINDMVSPISGGSMQSSYGETMVPGSSTWGWSNEPAVKDSIKHNNLAPPPTTPEPNQSSQTQTPLSSQVVTPGAGLIYYCPPGSQLDLKSYLCVQEIQSAPKVVPYTATSSARVLNASNKRAKGPSQ